MFISFPAIADERVELGSLASSSRNDALSDKHVESIAKRAFQRIMIECKFNSYYDEPNIVYLTQTVLLETTMWKATKMGHICGHRRNS